LYFLYSFIQVNIFLLIRILQLNQKQEEAKNHINGPLLIIAWAWSWKTATLTARVEYMIKEKGIDPSEILAVTFTNKAAKEMRARIGKSLGIEIGNNPYRTRGLPFIGTFHGMWVFFLKEVINMFADSDELRLGIKKDFIIYDASDTLSILKSIAKEMNMDEKEYPSRKIQSYISNAKNKLYTPKMYEQSVDNHFKEVVADVYYKYEKKLNENNALDFDDILVKTLDALKNPTVQRYYNDKYKYIMIDEYQDTNKPQYEIVKFLAAKHQNLAVVWDDWQSIYSWRWADMTNIINFKKDYPEAKVVKLEQNYRSTLRRSSDAPMSTL